jgi:hypothetical protein
MTPLVDARVGDDGGLGGAPRRCSSRVAAGHVGGVVAVTEAASERLGATPASGAVSGWDKRPLDSPRRAMEPAAVASVVIGGYAGLFLFTAAMAGRWDTAADCALFFVFIAVANAIVDAARRWSRHHDSLLDRRSVRRNARRL